MCILGRLYISIPFQPDDDLAVAEISCLEKLHFKPCVVRLGTREPITDSIAGRGC